MDLARINLVLAVVVVCCGRCYELGGGGGRIWHSTLRHNLPGHVGIVGLERVVAEIFDKLIRARPDELECIGTGLHSRSILKKNKTVLNLIRHFML